MHYVILVNRQFLRANLCSFFSGLTNRRLNVKDGKTATEFLQETMARIMETWSGDFTWSILAYVRPLDFTVSLHLKKQTEASQLKFGFYLVVKRSYWRLIDSNRFSINLSIMIIDYLFHNKCDWFKSPLSN